MQKSMWRAAILLLLSQLLACSGDEPAENVFEAQTSAINKAEEATRQMQEAAEKQREAIEAQGR